MIACNKCLENNWSYHHETESTATHRISTITATCKMCGSEVSWDKSKPIPKGGLTVTFETIEGKMLRDGKAFEFPKRIYELAGSRP